MSQSNFDSSFWSQANKLLAFAFVAGAGIFPTMWLYGGVKASYDLRHPEAVEGKAKSTDTPVPIVVAQATTPSPPPAPAAPGGGNAAGQTVYMTVCFACHQPTGMGLPNMFPPLAGSDWVNAPKPDRIIRNVLHGVMGPININGKPFTTPAPMMPPQGAALNDEQIANVLTYVRSSWGNKASAVTPDQVKAIRDAEKARTAMWSEADLLKIPVR